MQNSTVASPNHSIWGIIQVLCMPKIWHTSLKTVDSKLDPWFVCKGKGTPKMETLLTKALAIVVASWSLNRFSSKHVFPTNMFLFPLSVLGNGPRMSIASRSKGASTYIAEALPYMSWVASSCFHRNDSCCISFLHLS